MNTRQHRTLLLLALTCAFALGNTAFAALILNPPTPTCSIHRYDGIEITWDAVPHAAQYIILRSTYSGFTEYHQVATTTQTSFLDTTTTSGVNYYYAIAVKDKNGNVFKDLRKKSNGRQYSIKAIKPTASTNNPDGVWVYWNRVEGAYGYKIMCFSSVYISTGQPTCLATVGPDSTDYLDTTAKPDKPRYYWVWPLDNLGRSFQRSDYYAVGMRTNAAKLDVPTPVCTTNLTTGINVTWEENLEAKYFKIRRGTTSDYNASTELVIVFGRTSTSYLDEEAKANKTYYYWILPANTAGILSEDASRYGTGKRVKSSGGSETDKPTPPQPTATNDLTTHVRVTWAEVSGAASYKVKRGTSSSYSKATIIASNLTSPEYNDASATVGVTYYYWVLPVNSSGKSFYNSSRYATGKRVKGSGGSDTPSTGSLTPPQPTATTDNKNYVQVSWTKVTGAVQYKVRRGTSSNYSKSTVIATVTQTSYQDTSAAKGKTYYYWIVPVNNDGKSFYDKGKYAKGKRSK